MSCRGEERSLWRALLWSSSVWFYDGHRPCRLKLPIFFSPISLAGERDALLIDNLSGRAQQATLVRLYGVLEAWLAHFLWECAVKILADSAHSACCCCCYLHNTIPVVLYVACTYIPHLPAGTPDAKVPPMSCIADDLISMCTMIA